MLYRFLLIILIIVVFNLNGETMYGDTQTGYWKRPTFIKWDDAGIHLGGIIPNEMECFYVWSVDKEKMLWYMSMNKPRYQVYSKESRNKSTFIKYKSVLNEWRQWVPYNVKPRLIKKGERIKVFFNYTEDWYFGPRGHTVNQYLVRSDTEYEIIDINEELDLQICEKIMSFISKKSLPPFRSQLDAEEIQKKENKQ